MNKVLIIGNHSFIGSNLFSFLKKKFFIKKLSFNDFKKKNTNFFRKFTHIINCSINPNYVKYKYKSIQFTYIDVLEARSSFIESSRSTYLCT